MNQEGPRAQSQDDLATLSDVAEFVINLSIAERSHLIYGAQHPMALATVHRVSAAMRSVLQLQDPIELRFTEDMIFCGANNLERGHPIFQRLAAKMWRFGVAGITFQKEAAKELEQLISLFNYGERHQCSRQEFEEHLQKMELDRIQVVLLRTLVSFSEQDEVEARVGQERQLEWEDFIRELAVVGQLGGGKSETPTAQAAAATEPPAVEDLSQLMVDDEELAPDYATAVIDYMKRVERHHRQDTLLQETELGRKLGDFLAGVSPELRHQVMSSALTSEEISPETLQNLIDLGTFEHLVDSLRRISAEGTELPPTVFRTLSVMGSLRQTESQDRGETVAEGYSNEDFETLIGSLFSEDKVDSYMSTEYTRTMAELQRRAERIAKGQSSTLPELDLELEEGEAHFIDAGFALLDRFPEHEQLQKNVIREAERTILDSALEGPVETFCAAMGLVRRARLESPSGDGEEVPPPVWETDQVLDLLAERLDSRDRKVAQEGVDLMVAIGAPGVDKLIEILEKSETITTRKRGLEVLEEIDESPADKLLPLLEEDQAWYVQRNAVYVFHRRSDDTGAEKCKRLWETAPVQVKVEILRYLLGLGHEDASALLRDALDDRDRSFALWAARQAVKTGDRDNRLAVIEREQRIPAYQLGSGFHLDLLGALTRSGATGRAYVVAAAEVRAPILPWRKARFASEMAQLLEENPS